MITFIFLLPLLQLPTISTLLTCSKCDLPNENCFSNRQTCRGDFCFHSQYYYSNELNPTIQKGCVIGDVGAVGCRVNHYGNVMCICNDSDHCNANLTTLADVESSILPVQTCQPSKITNTPKPRWVRPCAGNYCTFMARKPDNNTSSNYTYLTKDCNHENEFDFFPTFTFFNFLPNMCIWLEYGGEPSIKACYGDNTLDTTLQIDETLPKITCHVDYFSPHLPYVKTGDTCVGQFCFITATAQGDVYRGCVSSAVAPGATQALKIGYTKSQNGLEQWLCDQESCNADLKSAEMSWPPELYLYRGISNLREFNVFYIDSSHTPSTYFLAIFPILIAFFQF